MFALPLLGCSITGSPLNLSITAAAEVVPYLGFGLVTGPGSTGSTASA